MRINQTTDYAIQILYHIAKEGKTVSSGELSKKILVSRRYLLNITAKLRDNGMIGVKTGPGGGYYLSRELSRLNLYDIIVTMEGTTKLSYYFENKKDKDNRSTFQDVYKVIQSFLDACLKEMTLEALLHKTSDEWHGIISDLFNAEFRTNG